MDANSGYRGRNDANPGLKKQSEREVLLKCAARICEQMRPFSDAHINRTTSVSPASGLLRAISRERNVCDVFKSNHHQTVKKIGAQCFLLWRA